MQFRMVKITHEHIRHMPSPRTAIIIGAGPAGLTAAHELIEKTDIRPILLETSDELGGLARTIAFKGNRIDIGGHRFFSRSDRIRQWWLDILPLQGAPAADDLALGRELPLSDKPGAPDPSREDRVMLIRNRVSRILFIDRLFDYPVSLNTTTLANLGLLRSLRICASYVKSLARPIPDETSLEDYFINRFGRELYSIFFRDYTEKLWGVPCESIQPEWGAQRVKGLSIAMSVRHALLNRMKGRENDADNPVFVRRFFYPKLGPGQLWEQAARNIRDKGGLVFPGHRVVGLKVEDGLVRNVIVNDLHTGETAAMNADYVFSTMPVSELIQAMSPAAPEHVREIAGGLRYRDFITVGILLKSMRIRNLTNIPTLNNIIPDNWIYIQEKNVRLGRIQIYNNWSPYLVEDPDTIWIGLEYFCNEGDDLWRKDDEDITRLALGELNAIGFVDSNAYIDRIVIRVPKAYPAYVGSYRRFQEIRDYTDRFANLFLIGRNGMHRYNNMDHSMLTAITAVRNILDGNPDKQNIWAVNTEEEYHESP